MGSAVIRPVVYDVRSRVRAPRGCSRAALLALALALASSVVGCERAGGTAARASAARAVDAAPPHVGPGERFTVGMMAYRVVRAAALRQVGPASAPRPAPAGSVYVLLEFERTWNGEGGITAPDGPLELVLASGQRVAQDLAAVGAHILATNCGDLGPARLSNGTAQRTCEVFVVPEGVLSGLSAQPSALAHRGFARPMAELGPLSAPAP